jgi:hypothetical protein
MMLKLSGSMPNFSKSKRRRTCTSFPELLQHWGKNKNLFLSNLALPAHMVAVEKFILAKKSSQKFRSIFYLPYSQIEYRDAAITYRNIMRHMTFHKGTLFPEKLHCMLEYAEDQGLHDILTWTGNGLAFIVHEPDMLTMTILPIFFGATKYRSFVRQLNNWSFHRCTGYSACHNNNSNSSSTIFEHPYFIRGKKSLCENLTRESFKRSSDNTSRAQISCSFSRHHETKRNKNKTRRKAATAALHVQMQNIEDISNNDTSSSPLSCSTNGQISASVVTMMDPEPPGFIMLTPCKSSDSIVLSSDAWATLETALLKANEEDDDMNSFLDGDLIDFEGQQFYFLDLKP